MKCQYQLTYDELILGTHELDECNFMCVVCEGCSQRIYKQEQIKHESLECSNPLAKCHFCTRIFNLREMSTHMRSCSKRSIVKVEYIEKPSEHVYENTKLKLIEFDHKPDQEYQPGKSGSSAEKRKNAKKSKETKNAPTYTCSYCDEQVPCTAKDTHPCSLIERKIRKEVNKSVHKDTQQDYELPADIRKPSEPVRDVSPNRVNHLGLISHQPESSLNQQPQ